MKQPPTIKHVPVPPYFVGFDPGMSGGWGVIDSSAWFIDGGSLPITELGRAGEFDTDHLNTIIDGIATGLMWDARTVRPVVQLEWPQTRPDEAPESSKRFGVGLGLIEGMCIAHGLRVERVAPNKWKGRLGLTNKDKGGAKEAVEFAEQVIRGLPAGIVRGPRGGLRDGVAEALLIAWWKCGETLAGLRNMPEDQRYARVVMGRQGRRRLRT